MAEASRVTRTPVRRRDGRPPRVTLARRTSPPIPSADSDERARARERTSLSSGFHSDILPLRELPSSVPSSERHLRDSTRATRPSLSSGGTTVALAERTSERYREMRHVGEMWRRESVAKATYLRERRVAKIQRALHSRRTNDDRDERAAGREGRREGSAVERFVKRLSNESSQARVKGAS